ncbi:acid protease [Epithele typhae]|uniref:acid protease n=1 Tax=Epithele typhae TaxID=378194 RepID=UPI002008A3A6|nr:acid protease [Epithele typhae]KAH9934531.1 acid protease [Epithele typhae]
MFARLPLLALCACVASLASLSSASPVSGRAAGPTLSVTRQLNLTGVPSIIEADRARAKMLLERATAQNATAMSAKQAAGFVPVDATNQVVHYIASVGVGSPPTFYDLLIDTGSSNTWVGASKAYVNTSTSVSTGEQFGVLYGSGLVFGYEYTDTVTLGDAAITGQGIGVASTTYGFDGVDGILGIGPVALTEGSTSGSEAIPTVTDNMFSQGLIEADLVGITFVPSTVLESTNGQLSFGAVDESKYTGDITYVPITSTSPASYYVGIDQSITYGSSNIPILSTTAGITDTGTTLVYIASEAFAAYQKATGAVPDDDVGLLKITAEQFASLESLFFHFGDHTFEFTANAQIWPRPLNTAIGGDADSIYLIVADWGTDSGEGLDFIDGMTFLERFYHVYDTGNSQVGFALTENTFAEIN